MVGRDGHVTVITRVPKCNPCIVVVARSLQTLLTGSTVCQPVPDSGLGATTGRRGMPICGRTGTVLVRVWCPANIKCDLVIQSFLINSFGSIFYCLTYIDEKGFPNFSSQNCHINMHNVQLYSPITSAIHPLSFNWVVYLNCWFSIVKDGNVPQKEQIQQSGILSKMLLYP